MVITTLGHSWLSAAIDSVIAQTYRPDEIIVVDDRGPADRTPLPLSVDDDRIIVARTHGKGANHARNQGVRLASCDLIALLDDDDLWYPHKLERQVALFLQSTRRDFTVVTCKALVESAGRVYPRFPYSGGGLADFLFCGHFPRIRYNGFVQTSSLLCPRSLALAHPFREDLLSHQDWDWLLALEAGSALLQTVDEPLYVYSAPSHDGISSALRLNAEHAWALRTLPLGSKALFGYFVSVATPKAIRNRQFRTAARALWLGVRYGHYDASTALMGATFSACSLGHVSKQLTLRLMPRCPAPIAVRSKCQ